MKGDIMKKVRYTLKEISKEHKTDVKLLRRYISEGALRATKVGRTYLVTSGDLNTFLKANYSLGGRRADANKAVNRNYLCQSYDHCLDVAARANKNFDCGACKKFSPSEKQLLSSHELAGICALWGSVFGKDVYLR